MDIKVLYIIIKKSQNMEEQLGEQKCEICKEIATNMCFECSYYLCDDCFEFIHKKNANSEHKKEEIDPL